MTSQTVTPTLPTTSRATIVVTWPLPSEEGKRRSDVVGVFLLEAAVTRLVGRDAHRAGREVDHEVALHELGKPAAGQSPTLDPEQALAQRDQRAA